MNVDSQAFEKVQVNAKTAEAKVRSKRELFMMLKHDCQTYLPDHPDCVTTYFLKDIVSGKKKRKCSRPL